MTGPLGTGFAETGFGCSLLEDLFAGGETDRNANGMAAGGLLIANESH